MTCELIDAEFFLQLALRAIACPASLDRDGRRSRSGAGGQIGEIAFWLPEDAPFASCDASLWREANISVFEFSSRHEQFEPHRFRRRQKEFIVF